MTSGRYGALKKLRLSDGAAASDRLPAEESHFAAAQHSLQAGAPSRLGPRAINQRGARSALRGLPGLSLSQVLPERRVAQAWGSAYGRGDPLRHDATVAANTSSLA